MNNNKILLIVVLFLNGCSLVHIETLVSSKQPVGSQASCSESGRVLSCDWDNVTDDWNHVEPSEFRDHLDEE